MTEKVLAPIDKRLTEIAEQLENFAVAPSIDLAKLAEELREIAWEVRAS